MKNTMLLVLLSSLLLLASCSAEKSLRKEIDMANHCATQQDCVNVGSKCPFGCYIYTHASEADRIRGLLENFQSNCEYSCISCPTVACVDNKCQPVCE